MFAAVGRRLFTGGRRKKNGKGTKGNFWWLRSWPTLDPCPPPLIADPRYATAALIEKVLRVYKFSKKWSISGDRA